MSDGKYCPADVPGGLSWRCEECGRGRGRLAWSDTAPDIKALDREAVEAAVQS